MTAERLLLEKEQNQEHIRQHLERYKFAANFARGKRVLDIACGTGYGSNLLKVAGASIVTGVDISSESIAYAKNNYQSDGINFIVGDATDLSNHRDFDVIVSFETIEHLDNPDKFLAEISLSLSSGGIFIVSTPMREKGTVTDRPTNPFHHQEWSKNEFKTLLRRYFSIVDLQGQYNFHKNSWLPYSRTIKRAFCRLFYPEIFKPINSYFVRKEAPICARFKFSPAYIIALCKLK
jgi:SAM-dependent methyltransferase